MLTAYIRRVYSDLQSDSSDAFDNLFDMDSDNNDDEFKLANIKRPGHTIFS